MLLSVKCQTRRYDRGKPCNNGKKMHIHKAHTLRDTYIKTANCELH